MLGPPQDLLIYCPCALSEEVRMEPGNMHPEKWTGAQEEEDKQYQDSLEWASWLLTCGGSYFQGKICSNQAWGPFWLPDKELPRLHQLHRGAYAGLGPTFQNFFLATKALPPARV